MPMTVAVTRNAAPRVRGFLVSVMLEVAPGVFTAPRMNKAVRERVQRVLWGWEECFGLDRGVLLTWPDAGAPRGQGLWIVGDPPTELVDHDGVVMARKGLSKELRGSLESDGLT